MAKRTKEHNAAIGEALRARGAGRSPTKVCPRCSRRLPRSAFPTRPNGFTASYCVPCGREYNAARQRAWVARHPEYRPNPADQRVVKLRYRYGIEPEQYDALTAAQSGGCAVCGARPKGGEHLHVDHDHESGSVRGLLCPSCNKGLGHFQDDAERMRAAIRYLGEWHLTSHPPREVTE